MFCAKCGSILLPKKEGSKKVLVCSCGYKSSNVEHTKLTETVDKKEKEVGDGDGDEKKVVFEFDEDISPEVIRNLIQ